MGLLKFWGQDMKLTQLTLAETSSKRVPGNGWLKYKPFLLGPGLFSQNWAWKQLKHCYMCSQYISSTFCMPFERLANWKGRGKMHNSLLTMSNWMWFLINDWTKTTQMLRKLHWALAPQKRTTINKRSLIQCPCWIRAIFTLYGGPIVMLLQLPKGWENDQNFPNPSDHHIGSPGNKLQLMRRAWTKTNPSELCKALAIWWRLPMKFDHDDVCGTCFFGENSLMGLNFGVENSGVGS